LEFEEINPKEGGMARTNFYANPAFEKVHFRTEFIRFVARSKLAYTKIATN